MLTDTCSTIEEAADAEDSGDMEEVITDAKVCSVSVAGRDDEILRLAYH